MFPIGNVVSSPFNSTDEAMHYASRFYGDDLKVQRIEAYFFVANKFFMERSQAADADLDALLDIGFSRQFCRECLAEVARLRDRYF